VSDEKCSLPPPPEANSTPNNLLARFEVGERGEREARKKMVETGENTPSRNN